MQKLVLPLSKCLPGMITSEAIRNKVTGTVLVGEGQVLTAENIETLSDWGIVEVGIFVNSWDTVWQLPEETLANYEVHTEEVAPLLEKIALGHDVDVDAFQGIKDNILDEFKDNFKIVGCINLFKVADKYTYTHSINVALLSMLIGKWMKFSPSMIESLLLAGLLHDIGKMKIDPKILHKPGPLTPSEFEEMKKHPQYSYDLLKYHPEISLDVKVGILMHHERMDGSGYPYSVYGDNINDIAKVLAIADTYDAMISERPYKKKQSPFDVMKLIQEGVFGKMDTKMLLCFLNNVANYYLDVYVLLNTGQIGQVVAINPTCVYRPIIKVDNQYIDLLTERSITIVELT